MNVVSRILFWLSLAGMTLSLIAPASFGGASWREAQPAVIAGALLVLFFAGASLATTSVRSPDPSATARARRGTGIAYGVVSMLALGVGGLVAYEGANSDLSAISYRRGEARRVVDRCVAASQRDRDLERDFGVQPGTFAPSASKTHQDCQRIYGGSSTSFYDSSEVDDAETGHANAAVGLAGAALGLIALIAFASKRVPAAHPHAGHGYVAHGHWGPYAQHGHPPQFHGPHGYAPNQYVPPSYGQQYGPPPSAG